jgi:type III restriction enzyme
VFDSARPIRSTGDMPPWFTGRPCEHTDHSHINQCVFDSTWEASEEYVVDKRPRVAAWVKNDHLGFEIVYVYRGVVKKYRPDFLIRLDSGMMLVLEVKGQETEEAKAKRTFLDEWVRAVNAHGGFGVWGWDMSREPGDVAGILLGQT